MIMTQFAMMDPGPAGSSWIARCCRAVSSFFGFGDAPHRTKPEETTGERGLPAPPASLEAVPTPPAPVSSLKWRRHEQLRHRPASTLPDEERVARQDAVHGLYAAHAGQLDDALTFFTRAAGCEAVDLAEVPGFWQLPRNAMLTAVDAYEATNRFRDASALGARIRKELRPRVLGPVPRNVTELPSGHVRLTGNS